MLSHHFFIRPSHVITGLILPDPKVIDLGLLLNDCVGWQQCQWELIVRSALGKQSRLKEKCFPSQEKPEDAQPWVFSTVQKLEQLITDSLYKLYVHIVFLLFICSHKKRAECFICWWSQALTNHWSAFEKQAVLRMRCKYSYFSSISTPDTTPTVSRD